MKSIITKSVFFIAILSGVLTGCVNGDDYSNPDATCVDPGLTPTKTVAEINALATSSVPTLYEGDDIIEAYVTTSDEKGNIYKSISFQTLPAPGVAPIGFSVPVNATSTFIAGFTPGKKVYIKLKGLYYAKVYGSMQIGSLYQSSPTSAVEIGRISETEYKNFLIPSCDEVTEDQLVRSLPFSQVFNDANQNTLIDIEAVQFGDGSVGRTFYDVDSGGGSTNHSIIAATIPSTGAEQILRISSYSPFAGHIVPSESGKIRGVLTKYESDYQFMIRFEDDIQLDQPRVDPNPPKGGTAIDFLPVFNETFESYAVTSNGTTFPKYVNDAYIGSRYWDVKTFSSNKYIQMTAFGAAGATKTYLMMPVAFTPGNKFSFKSKDGYNVGNVLKVYYSTNYVAGGDVADATLVNITSNFAIASGTTTGYATNFTNSGDFVIPASLTGNGYFIFEYTGNGADGITTTIQIDDVKVVQ